jgi:hypothetical protein
MAQPVGESSGGPQGDQRKCGEGNLRDTAKPARIAISVENFPPGPRIGRCTTRIVFDFQ